MFSRRGWIFWYCETEFYCRYARSSTTPLASTALGSQLSEKSSALRCTAMHRPTTLSLPRRVVSGSYVAKEKSDPSAASSTLPKSPTVETSGRRQGAAVSKKASVPNASKGCAGPTPPPRPRTMPVPLKAILRPPHSVRRAVRPSSWVEAAGSGALSSVQLQRVRAGRQLPAAQRHLRAHSDVAVAALHTNPANRKRGSKRGSPGSVRQKSGSRSSHSSSTSSALRERGSAKAARARAGPRRALKATTLPPWLAASPATHLKFAEGNRPHGLVTPVLEEQRRRRHAVRAVLDVDEVDPHRPVRPRAQLRPREHSRLSTARRLCAWWRGLGSTLSERRGSPLYGALPRIFYGAGACCCF